LFFFLLHAGDMYVWDRSSAACKFPSWSTTPTTSLSLLLGPVPM